MDAATVEAMLQQHFDNAASDPERAHLSILELRGEQIACESIYVTEGFEAPEWRAQWRAEP